jgi:curved DNA-binding protein CbpA
LEPLDQNFYEILELPPDATAQHVERAYRIARATYQPASTATYSVFTDEENAELLRRIEEAFAVLSDARLRREYDARLRREGAPAEHTSRNATAPAPRPPEPAAWERRGLPNEPEVVAAEVPENGEYDGRALHQARISRGIEIEEVAAVTKVSETYLKFIEQDRYADLPAAVYVRGFVREIARCLKLDPKLVCDGYMARYEQARESG